MKGIVVFMKNPKTTLSGRRNSIRSTDLLYRKTDLSIKGGIWVEETKKWLNRAYTIDKEIKNLESELQKANLAATSLATQRIGEKVQTSRMNNADYAILKCIEYSEQIVKKLGELYAKKIEISETISMVDDGKHRALLRMRYLKYMSWMQIANEMDYTERNVHYLHDKALEEVKEIISYNFSVKCDIM